MLRLRMTIRARSLTMVASIIITSNTSNTMLTTILEIKDLENKKESGEVEDDHGGQHHQPAPQEHETPDVIFSPSF